MKDEWTDCRETAPDRSDRDAIDPDGPRRTQPTHSQNQVRQRYTFRGEGTRTHAGRTRASSRGDGPLRGQHGLCSHTRADTGKMLIKPVSAQCVMFMIWWPSSSRASRRQVSAILLKAAPEAFPRVTVQ